MAARAQTTPVSGTETVTVLCKIPQGFELVVHEERKLTQVGLGHSKEVSEWFPTDKVFRLNGSAHAQNEGPRCRTIGGYAVTEGVPKDLWESWLGQFKKHPAVVNCLICAFDDGAYAADFANENRKSKTGLERLNPNALPNLDPRFKVVTADDQVAPIGFVEE